MPIELQQTSIVMLGSWNPAIISPAWLYTQAVVAKLPPETQFGFQPLNRSIRFELAGMSWEASDSRLAITCSAMKNCGTYAAKVLNLLRHTPIQAVGTNFVFQSALDDWPRGDIAGIRDLTSPHEMAKLIFPQVVWQASSHIDSDTVLKLTATRNETAGETSVVVSFNLHRNCNDAMKARRFVRLWRRDRDTVLDILKREFKVDIS